MAKFEAILLDLGGTLLHLDYPFMSGEFDKRGFRVEEDRFFLGVAEANRALDEIVLRDKSSTDVSRWGSFFTSLLDDLNVPFEHSLFIEEVLRPRHETVNLWNYTLPGTHQVLEELAGRYRIALISNSD